MKYIRFVFLIAFFSCLSAPNNQQPVTSGMTIQKPTGITIDNRQRQGFQYKDSTGREYNYRYYTITVTNDSILPLQLKISLSRNNSGALDTVQSRFFLLPRALTPDAQHFDEFIAPELLAFLN